MGETTRRDLDAAELAVALRDTRRHLLDLFEDLDDQQLIGPEHVIVNPPLWEVGHVAWFHEKWMLRRHGGRAPLRADGDALYDSAAVEHHDRWVHVLPPRDETLSYMRTVLDAVLERLEEHGDDESFLYFARLGLFHEDMHVEAMLYTRQTLGYAAPRFLAAGARAPAAGPTAGPAAETGDVEVPGGTYTIGAVEGDGFVFDIEKWAHEVELAPFAIARQAVTQGELAAFVDDGGYAREELWTEAGWRWRTETGAEHPLHWRREGSAWSRAVFDDHRELEPDLAMIHANAYEAEAWCRWAGRRLPTEAEWEVAAAGTPEPEAERVHMDFAGGGQAPASARAAGDGPRGCRQMLGNVWEWTATPLGPYPGFEVDPYEEYSRPWFGTHRVLRGGSWATRTRLIRPTWRNFYTPDRRDVWAGFRTCAP
jgi:iron(II)-dependent oxidoreductase